MRGAVVAGLSLLVLVVLFAPGARASDVETQLQKAEDAAVRGEEARAIELYEALLDEGEDSAELRYNLGTLYLAADDVGPAVLHLRTALQQDPAHDDAAHNLEVALAARKDRIIDADLERPLEEQLAATLAPDAAGLALLGALAGLALLFGAIPWTPRRLRRIVVALFIAACVPASLLAVVVGAQAIVLSRKEAVVLADEVVARVAPSIEAAPSFTAHPGLYGRVLEEEAGFVRLRLDNGLDAWLPKDAVGFVGE